MATQQQIDACVDMVNALQKHCWSTANSGPLALYQRTLQCAEVVASPPQMSHYKGATEYENRKAHDDEVLYVAENAMKVLVQTHMPQHLTVATKTDMMNKFAQDALAQEAKRK